MSTKEKDTKVGEKEVKGKVKKSAPQKSGKVKKEKIEQLDGNCDSSCESDNIMQIDGSDDNPTVKTRRQKKIAASKAGKHLNTDDNPEEESVSPPKRPRTKAAINQEIPGVKVESAVNKQVDSKKITGTSNKTAKSSRKSLSFKTQENLKESVNDSDELKIDDKNSKDVQSPRKTRSKDTEKESLETLAPPANTGIVKGKNGKKTSNPPKIVVSSHNDNSSISSKYFDADQSLLETKQLGRKRSRTSEPKASTKKSCDDVKKQRTRSAHNIPENKSKYFSENKEQNKKSTRSTKGKIDNKSESQNRVSHRDLAKQKKTSKNDVTNDLVNIIKERVKEAKDEAKKGIVKGNLRKYTT